MAMGRGSASKNIALVMLVLCLISYCKVAESARYVVGGSSGWTFNTVGWPNGKRFKAGDVLVFNYNPGVHNVVAVSAAGYKSCSTPRGAKVFSSGKDSITLRRGTSYFICSVVGHCQSAMKIAVTAA